MSISPEPTHALNIRVGSLRGPTNARARQLIDHAISRALELAHVPTLANAYLFKTVLEMFRGDARAALRDAELLVEIAERNGLAWFLDLATLKRGWARARLGDREAGVVEMLAALGRFAERRTWGFFPLSLGQLAGLEAAQSADEASAHIDEALALAERTGERWTDALLNRIRGDVLLKAHPENPAAAEQAYRDAVAIARVQPARSFGLQAALALAKLYQSTDRPAEAHAVLAPALEGFSPTPELPQIAEAQVLLASLAESEEVKAQVAQRHASSFTLREWGRRGWVFPTIFASAWLRRSSWAGCRAIRRPRISK